MSQPKPSISTSFSYETLEETLDIKPRIEGMMIGIPKEIAFQKQGGAYAGCSKCINKQWPPGNDRA
jgi:hypothetical protein